MDKQNTALTDTVDIIIRLKPHILQTDAHTGRAFEDLRDPNHEYGKRMIEGTIRQQHPTGTYDFRKTTRDGFVLRWRGNPQVEKREINGLATALMYIAEEVRREKTGQKKEVISPDTLRQWYGAAFTQSTNE